jgi:hypothetical protein
MQLQSASIFPPRPSINEAIPYSTAALRQDLERLRGIWEDCQANRDRNAIYGLPDRLVRPCGLVDRGRPGN